MGMEQASMKSNLNLVLVLCFRLPVYHYMYMNMYMIRALRQLHVFRAVFI